MFDVEIPPTPGAIPKPAGAGASLARVSANALKAILLPSAAVLTALLGAAILLGLNGFHAIDVVTIMIGSVFQNERSVAEVLVRATPLILIGVGLCVAFRCSVWNIGAEGQFYMGAVGATISGIYFTWLPPWLHIILVLSTGALLGALWAAIAGLLKVAFKTSEIVTTIMLNYVAIFLTSYLVTGPLKDPHVDFPQSSRLLRDIWLPRFLPPTRLHIGVLIAVGLAIFLYVFLFRSSAGYAVRVVGINPHAARYAGINIARNVLLAISISGATAGLAGAVEIAGVTFRLYQSISPGYGFEAIAVALLANNNPIGALFSGVLFAALQAGSELMQINAQVPQVLVFVIQGMVILSVVAFGALKVQAARPLE